MAQPPREPAKERGSEFVNRIVSDPKNVPDVMRLYGYPGESSEEGHERLYLSPDLQNYVEVPRNAVLERMAVAKEQDPYGAVVLWVRRDAELKSKMAPAAAALAQYFAGAIQGAAAAAGAEAVPAAAMAGLPRFGVSVYCHSAHPPPFCVPPTFICTFGPPQCPPTQYIGCPHASDVPCTAVACPLAAAGPAVGAAAMPGAAGAGIQPGVAPFITGFYCVRPITLGCTGNIGCTHATICLRCIE